MTTLCLDDLDFNLDDIASVEDSRESFSQLASNVCVREQLEITLNDPAPAPSKEPHQHTHGCSIVLGSTSGSTKEYLSVHEELCNLLIHREINGHKLLM